VTEREGGEGAKGEREKERDFFGKACVESVDA